MKIPQSKPSSKLSTQVLLTTLKAILSIISFTKQPMKQSRGRESFIPAAVGQIRICD